MRLVLLGMPGAGKGTQGHALAERLHVPHVSSGELLRHEVATHTALGHDIERWIAAGELVPDDLVYSVIAGALDDTARARGYILDGFPRTRAQAERAAAAPPPTGIAIDAVVYIDISDDLARSRLSTRAALGRRDDDDAVIERRLRVYHEATEPLLAFYRQLGVLHPISGDAPVEQVTAAILASLGVAADPPPSP